MKACVFDNSGDEIEGFGDFCHRVGIPAVEEYMKEYTLGSYVDMVDPFRENVEVGDAKIGVRDEVLALLQAQARRRGVTPETLLDLMVSEAFEGDEGDEGDGPGAVFYAGRDLVCCGVTLIYGHHPARTRPWEELTC